MLFTDPAQYLCFVGAKSVPRESPKLQPINSPSKKQNLTKEKSKK